MRNLRTRLPAVLIATAVAVVAAVVPASAAHAVNSNGTGWAASWKYYSVDKAHWVLRVPGGFANGFIDDSGVNRVLQGSVVDPIPGDNRCVRWNIRGVTSGGSIQQTACNGTTSFNATTSDEPLEFSVQTVVTGTTVVDDRVTFQLNSTSIDPKLGQTGSESTWQYDTTTSFSYTLARPGVRMTGSGTTLPGPAGRLIIGTVTNTDPTGCAEGMIDVFDGGFTGFKTACGANSTADLVALGTGSIDVWACALPAGGTFTRCVFATIAKLT
jgi:hypothetical protein